MTGAGRHQGDALASAGWGPPHLARDRKAAAGVDPSLFP